MAIHKGPVREQFTQIPNATHQDTSLSLQARGLLGYMISLPEDWIIRPEDLGKKNGIAKNTAYKIIKELKTAGYIIQFQGRKNGKFSSGDYLVFRSKEDAAWYAETRMNTEPPPCTKKRDTVKRDTVICELSNKQLTNKHSAAANAGSATPEPEFNFDLILAWVINQLKRSGYDLGTSDEVSIEAALQDYHDSAQKPRRAPAFDWCEQALISRMATLRRSARNGAARDKVSRSVVNQLETQAAVIDQHTRNMESKTGKTLERAMDDRSWDIA